ncbi:MAG: phosphate ABC transporter substrate-binding protein, partial [Gammaproteobacteria bacterium]|nr:phosphate ABC transporter substrate-binding protein [Gammaproteobacteria bacterium]
MTLQSADVRDLFLGDKQFSGSVHLVPVDNAAQQPAFLERVLKMSAAKYSTGWTKKAFRDGLTPPLVLGSDAEALAYVRRTSGACT